MILRKLRSSLSGKSSLCFCPPHKSDIIFPCFFRGVPFFASPESSSISFFPTDDLQSSSFHLNCSAFSSLPLDLGPSFITGQSFCSMLKFLPPNTLKSLVLRQEKIGHSRLDPRFKPSSVKAATPNRRTASSPEAERGLLRSLTAHAFLCSCPPDFSAVLCPPFLNQSSSRQRLHGEGQLLSRFCLYSIGCRYLSLLLSSEPPQEKLFFIIWSRLPGRRVSGI